MWRYGRINRSNRSNLTVNMTGGVMKAAEESQRQLMARKYVTMTLQLNILKPKRNLFNEETWSNQYSTNLIMIRPFWPIHVCLANDYWQYINQKWRKRNIIWKKGCLCINENIRSTSMYGSNLMWRRKLKAMALWYSGMSI